MNRRALGRTGIEVSEIGIGCWGIGGPMERDGTISGYGAVDDRESIRMLRHALDLGVNLFDTAPWYGNGHSERLIGEALAGRRREVLLATKVGIFLHEGRYTSDYSGDLVRRHVGESLERLRTEYIDIYQLHSPTPGQFREDGLDALVALRASGVVRAVGLSLPASIEESEEFYLPLCRAGAIDVVQVPYNLLKFEAESKLLPELASMGIGVICREPFFFGYLTGRFDEATVFSATTDVRSTWPRERHLGLVAQARRFDFLPAELGSTMSQAALAYCLSSDAIATVIPGAMTVPELAEDVEAARFAPLAPSLRDEVRRRQRTAQLAV
jgi:aryl-alcohol dehydrogenase-like predicted oxidoreductase